MHTNRRDLLARPTEPRSVGPSGSRLDCCSALSALSMISNSTLLNSCFSTVILPTLTQRHNAEDIRQRYGRCKIAGRRSRRVT
jgi:hypothetical protein